MKRKPLDPKSGIIDKNMIINIVVISLLMTSAVIILFLRWYQVDIMMARTGVLILLVLLEVMRVQMIRSNYNVGIFSNKRLI
jgi:Ca2+-transporting ATPase